MGMDDAIDLRVSFVTAKMHLRFTARFGRVAFDDIEVIVEDQHHIFGQLPAVFAAQIAGEMSDAVADTTTQIAAGAVGHETVIHEMSDFDHFGSWIFQG